MSRPESPRSPELTKQPDVHVERMRQQLLREFTRIRAEFSQLELIIAAIDTTTGNAPIGASYVTATVSGALTSERVLTAGTNITVTDNGANSTIVIDAASGAPVNASYVCIANNATLTAERVLAEGNGIDLVDGGANGNVTLAVDETELNALLIGGFAEAVDDRVAALCVEGNGIDLTYNDGAGTFTIAVDESELAMQAPTFVVLSNTAALPNERALTAGHGIDLADAGAGSTITVDVDETELDMQAPSYVTLANTAALPNERALTAGHGIDIVDAGAGSTITIDVDETELDIQAPQYVVIANTTALPNERRLREGHGIDITDGGAGGDVTVAVDETELTPSLLGIVYSEVDHVLYDIDFSTLGNNTFANGTESIDGFNWTAASVSNATRTVFDIQNGTGLRWTAPTSGAANVFTTATQSAAHIYIPLSTLIPTWDPEWTILVDLYFTTEVYENASDNVRVGIWLLAADGGSGSNRLRAAIKGKGPGAVSTIGTVQVSTLTFEAVDFSAHNCLGLKMDAVGIGGARYGTYGADFPVMNMVAFNTSTSTAGNVYTDTYGRLFLAFCNGASDASPTSAVTVRRLRVRRAG